MMRLIASAAELVCSVAKTRCPVSAMVSAACDGLQVAHFADENDVGILAQRVLERVGEAVRVAPHLALVDDAALVAVDELDRIFDRDDVSLALAVDLVDHGRERGGLARTGGAGDQDQTARLFGHAGDDRRQSEVLEGADAEWNLANGHRDAAALLEAVSAEPGQVLNAEREIELVLHLEPLLLVFGQHRVGQLQRVLRAEQGLDARVHDVAVDAQLWAFAGREMQVRRVALDHLLEQHAQVDGVRGRGGVGHGGRR